MNNFGSLTDLNLHGKVAEITSHLIEDYAQYGVTEASMEALSALNEQFSGDIQIAQTAAANAKATTSTKNATRQQVLDAIRATALIVYADPDVDDTLLNKAGFSPRPVYGTKTTPKQVTDLVANAFSDGRVTLKWNRSGNSTSTLFTIWARGASGSWTNVGSSTKLKTTLENFAPGTFKQFQVTATVNNQTSAPSNIASIYEVGVGTALQIAA